MTIRVVVADYQVLVRSGSARLLSGGPGLEAGQRAIVSVSPPGSGLTIDYQVVTAAAGAESRVRPRLEGSDP